MTAPNPSRIVSLREVDELCDQFESALQGGESPSLVDWVEKAGSDAERALVELAILDLEYRRKRGEPRTASDYFEQFPTLLTNADSALRLLEAEYRGASASDPTFDVADFSRRYSHLASHPGWPTAPWSRALADQAHADSASRCADSTLPPTPVRRDPGAFLRTVLTASDPPGELGRFGEYRVLETLGMGGMGIVLRAEDEALRRPVALKLMWPEVAALPQARARFLREARATAAIEHPRVISIYRVGEHEGTPFLAMPLLRGQSLATLLKQGPIPLDEAVRIARETAEGLAAAHDKGLIHRDIKPDNIWLEQTAEGVHVRLLDFGLARGNDHEGLTMTGQIVGTPAYMAPEQAGDLPIQAQADLFSLGAVVYEMVTNTRPFQRATLMATLSALASHHPTPPHEIVQGVSPELSEFILGLLHKKPEARPAGAAQVAQKLREFETGTTLPGRKCADRGYELWNRGWVKYALLVSGGIAVILLASIVIDRMRKHTEPSGELSGPVDSEVPLRVRSMRIKVSPPPNDGDARQPGYLMVDGVRAKLGDQVTIETTLTRPAHAYLVAFHPDGQFEVCYPEKESEPPPLGLHPSYPAQGRGDVYGLREGAGLWVFAVVASSKPLPAYAEWVAGKKPPWKRGEPGVPNRIWIDDGQWIDEIGPGGLGRGERGKGERQPGRTAIVELTDWLRKSTNAEAVYAVGFTVE